VSNSAVTVPSIICSAPIELSAIFEPSTASAAILSAVTAPVTILPLVTELTFNLAVVTAPLFILDVVTAFVAILAEVMLPSFTTAFKPCGPAGPVVTNFITGVISVADATIAPESSLIVNDTIGVSLEVKLTFILFWDAINH